MNLFICTNCTEYVQYLVYISSLVSQNFRRVRKNAKIEFCFRHMCLSTQNDSATAEQIFMQFGNGGFFENLSKKLNLHSNLTRITGYLPEELCTFMIISR